MARVAFCGLGSMGARMALRLLGAGHDVTVWNRTKDKAEPLVRKGARAVDSPAEAAEGAEAAITMLAGPEGLEHVVFGPRGLAKGLSPGAALIEMSTVGPHAVHASRASLPRQVDMLDSPVLGSLGEAERGELKIFVGGSHATYEKWSPVLGAMGTPRHIGSLGSGAAMKLVANSTLMALMTALAEALALGDALGLQEDAVLDVLGDSPIGVTARSKRSRIEGGVYRPNFKLALARKDAELVVDAARRAGLDLPVAEAARSHMQAAEHAGLGDVDYSAVIAHLRGKPARLP